MMLRWDGGCKAAVELGDSRSAESTLCRRAAYYESPE